MVVKGVIIEAEPFEVTEYVAGNILEDLKNSTADILPKKITINVVNGNLEMDIEGYPKKTPLIKKHMKYISEE